MAKKSKIEIPSRNFITDCMWMSYRYCIGRHTIAAAMHAPEMAKFISVNPDIISDDRRKFNAKDIREEISSVLRWRDDVHIDNFVLDVDAASLIMQHIVNAKLDMTKDWVFEVDLRTHEVKHHPATAKSSANIINDLSDLNPWIKLANWLDPHEEITYEYKGERKTEPGFTTFSIGRDITAHKVTCDTYIKNPYINTYIADEYIIKTNNI